MYGFGFFFLRLLWPLMSSELVFSFFITKFAGLNFRLFCNNQSNRLFQNIDFLEGILNNWCESSKIRTFSIHNRESPILFTLAEFICYVRNDFRNKLRNVIEKGHDFKENNDQQTNNWQYPAVLDLLETCLVIFLMKSQSAVGLHPSIKRILFILLLQVDN